MKYVIETSEEFYEDCKRFAEYNEADKVIANGIPLPKGHGRLIDADALKKESVMCPTVGNAETLLLDISDVENAPTIIEADEEGAEEKEEDILAKIEDELTDTGAWEQEVNGNTDFLKGISYCIDTIHKYKAEAKKTKY